MNDEYVYQQEQWFRGNIRRNEEIYFFQKKGIKNNFFLQTYLISFHRILHFSEELFRKLKFKMLNFMKTLDIARISRFNEITYALQQKIE